MKKIDLPKTFKAIEEIFSLDTERHIRRQLSDVAQGVAIGKKRGGLVRDLRIFSQSYILNEEQKAKLERVNAIFLNETDDEQPRTATIKQLRISMRLKFITIYRVSCEAKAFALYTMTFSPTTHASHITT